MKAKFFTDFWNMFLELVKMKKYTPEIKFFFKQFDSTDNPKKSIEGLINLIRKNPTLDDMFQVSRTYDMISRVEKRAEEKGWDYACIGAVEEMGVNYEIRGKENIPADIRALYVSNHPYGLLDGAILLGGFNSAVKKKQKKLKIIAMNQLKFIKGIEDIIYFVHSTAKKLDLGSVRKSLNYLKKEGDLAIYPSRRMSGEGLKEYPWRKGLGTLALYAPCIVPMWFSGPDHCKEYNFLARHRATEKLRRLFTFKEAWNKEGKTVVLNIGEPIESNTIKEMRKPQERVQYLRQIAESLRVPV
ncbi:hypothetical protein FJZ20_00630 [Candidatus Pacearchaeota archaeon]|nr:hypothetical protein [Candidatus Pacearchaeota archaeon]